MSRLTITHFKQLSSTSHTRASKPSSVHSIPPLYHSDCGCHSLQELDRSAKQQRDPEPNPRSVRKRQQLHGWIVHPIIHLQALACWHWTMRVRAVSPKTRIHRFVAKHNGDSYDLHKCSTDPIILPSLRNFVMASLGA
ncbi:hypothetical protein PAXRUDRAFT_261907 [Paxillus rubicundulus Ve08.2h10]|uniref:Uncharacterized protein n=1 Tax=Paxillus rubicundulus Ve08.2h10 TaxID=930991 RepID=A0A0D0E0N4_9AGAM|nr:hypothetical protein PAXRUDRAFT_261907 [Paxillus rubicundulus Ve08.2h10]